MHGKILVMHQSEAMFFWIFFYMTPFPPENYIVWDEWGPPISFFFGWNPIICIICICPCQIAQPQERPSWKKRKLIGKKEREGKKLPLIVATMLCLQWTRAVHALCSDQLVNTPHEIAEMVCSCPPPQMFGRPPPSQFFTTSLSRRERTWST